LSVEFGTKSNTSRLQVEGAYVGLPDQFFTAGRRVVAAAIP
jgi:hypothetical protein